MQQNYLQHDIRELKRYQKVLLTNRPFLRMTPLSDDEGIMRVCEKQKHPMLLPRDHPVTKLIITYLHVENAQIGQLSLMTKIRQ